MGDNNFDNQKQQFENLKQEIFQNIKQRFQSEFLNRLDKVLFFNPLNLADIEKIVDNKLNILNESLKDKKIQIIWNNNLVKGLAKLSYSQEGGAREVDKIIQDKIENFLVDKIIIDKIRQGDKISLKWKNGKINF